MNKFYSVFIALFALLLTACSNNDSLNSLNKNTYNSKSIKFTKKRDIISNNEVKYMFLITYLNPVDKSFKDEKTNTFLIGFHNIENEKNSSLENNGFSLETSYKLISGYSFNTSLDQGSDEFDEINTQDSYTKSEDEETEEEKEFKLKIKKPLEIIKLEKNSPLIKDISLKNSWATYYLVKFRATKDETSATLNIKNPNYKNITVSFSKL